MIASIAGGTEEVDALKETLNEALWGTPVHAAAGLQPYNDAEETLLRFMTAQKPIASYTLVTAGLANRLSERFDCVANQAPAAGNLLRAIISMVAGLSLEKRVGTGSGPKWRKTAHFSKSFIKRLLQIDRQEMELW